MKKGNGVREWKSRGEGSKEGRGGMKEAEPFFLGLVPYPVRAPSPLPLPASVGSTGYQSDLPKVQVPTPQCPGHIHLDGGGGVRRGAPSSRASSLAGTAVYKPGGCKTWEHALPGCCRLVPSGKSLQSPCSLLFDGEKHLSCKVILLAQCLAYHQTPQMSFGSPGVEGGLRKSQPVLGRGGGRDHSP